jgi:hypothetical protein
VAGFDTATNKLDRAWGRDMVDLYRAVRAPGKNGRGTPIGCYIKQIFVPRWILFDEH